MNNTSNNGDRTAAAGLRSRAEDQLKAESPAADLPRTEDETKRLLHELQVHQIELEMQNAELLQARDEVEKALSKYSDLYDFAPVGYIALDQNESIIDVNLSAASLLGGLRSRLIGQRFGHFIATGDLSTFTAFLGTVLISQVKETLEVRLLNNNDQSKTVQIDAMSSASGQEFHLALIDITGRKIQESRMLQAEKMETVVLLAGRIAHDFNVILNVIIGCGSNSDIQMEQDDPLRVNLDQIIAAASRGANLTRSLLNLSRQKPITLLPVDVNEIIRSAETFLRMVIGAEILLETACSKEVLKVNADSSQLEQVVINLATNSQHAMPDGGRLSIHTETVAMDLDFINLHGFGEPGKYALITVRDTGTGMDPETLRSIFVPFFTTMIRVKNGSGLGLSIVYSIIRQHKGFIDVSSVPDKGTTFRIFLPLTGTGQGPEKITSGKKRT